MVCNPVGRGHAAEKWQRETGAVASVAAVSLLRTVIQMDAFVGSEA